MRVIATQVLGTDAILLDAFRHHWTTRALAPTTIRASLSDVKRFRTWLAWVHEGTPPRLTQVRTVDLAAFRTHLLHEQAHTPATVNRRLQGLRLVFRWRHDHGGIAANAATHLRVMRQAPAQQPQALTRREVLALVHAAAQSPHRLGPRNVALIQLMLQAGLRVGEVTAVPHGDVRLSARAGTVQIRDGKGRKARAVPLNTTARHAVQAYVETLPVVTAPTPVFLSKRGTPLAVRSVQAMIAQLAKQAGLQRLAVSAHTLRHTFAGHYLQRYPGQLRDLAALLGHEFLDTTAIYTRPSHDTMAEDLERSPLNVFRG